MERPRHVTLPVSVRRIGGSDKYYELSYANNIKLTWGMLHDEAHWLAALINGTADTPADPDAGLSPGARHLIDAIRVADRDANATSETTLTIVRTRTHTLGRTIGGREGGAA